MQANTISQKFKEALPQLKPIQLSGLFGMIYEFCVYEGLIQLGKKGDLYYLNEKNILYHPNLDPQRSALFFIPDYVIFEDSKPKYVIMITHSETRADSHNKMFETLGETIEIRRWAQMKNIPVFTIVSIHGIREKGFRPYVSEFYKWKREEGNIFFDYLAECYHDKNTWLILGTIALSNGIGKRLKEPLRPTSPRGLKLRKDLRKYCGNYIKLISSVYESILTER
jgi:hypothetical protein